MIVTRSPLWRVVEETGARLVLRDSTPAGIAEGLGRAVRIDLAPLADRGLAAARARSNQLGERQGGDTCLMVRAVTGPAANPASVFLGASNPVLSFSQERRPRWRW